MKVQYRKAALQHIEGHTVKLTITQSQCVLKLLPFYHFVILLHVKL